MKRFTWTGRGPWQGARRSFYVGVHGSFRKMGVVVLGDRRGVKKLTKKRTRHDNLDFILVD
jgi:hypothetical protein